MKFKIDLRQIDFLTKKKVDYIQESPELESLFSKIESMIPGTIVCAVFEDDDNIKNVIQRGILFQKTDIVKKGHVSQCHANSADYYVAFSEEENISIVTGYALSEDSVWRQHSWIVETIDSGFKTIETTEKRLAYFGYILSSEESEVFCSDNY